MAKTHLSKLARHLIAPSRSPFYHCQHRSSDVGSIDSVKVKVFHVVAGFGGKLQRAANKVAAPPQRRPSVTSSLQDSCPRRGGTRGRHLQHLRMAPIW